VALIIIFFLIFSSTFVSAAALRRAGLQADSKLLLTIVGHVVNTQNSAIDEAEVEIFIGGAQQSISVAGEEVETAFTGPQGYFVIELMVTETDIERGAVALEITRPGYRTTRVGFKQEWLAQSGDQYLVQLPEIVLPRVLTPAFYIAAGIFLLVFVAFSLNLLHETIAALLGIAAMLGVSYFLGSSNVDYWIIDFHRAISFIDFDVIFLLLALMIFVAVMGETGVFQWLALQAFHLARGKTFLVAAGLITITGVISTVLNDTTVMLLMTPVSIQIALALGIHPAAIVIPEVLASNIGGAATLIGNPPNTIIGSYVGLTFNQFLVNMVPMATMSMAILLLMTRWMFRSEFMREEKQPSAALLEQLEKGAQITDVRLLQKSVILFTVTILLFFIADRFLMPPAVVAILGSSALLLWVRPDVNDMLREVDWTTLVFFMSLFMMVGGIQEVGLIQLITDGVQRLAAGNLLIATTLVIWVSAIASAIVANIPFTSAIIPVVVFLSQSIPGADNNVLYWALSLGACFGGNATYIGAAPNIIALGIMDRAGYRVKFGEFSRIGIPVTVVTLLVPMVWIFIRYFWLKF
jgi:Na+/H+ antiporter NhaD/arsenite permease-like protein